MRKTTILLAAPLTIGLMSGTALAASQSNTNATTRGTAATSAQTTQNSTDGSAAMKADGTAAAGDNTAGMESQSDMSKSTDETDHNDTESGEQKADAKQLVDGAAKVVTQMRSDRDVAKLLKKAKGVYVVPDFGRGGLIIGGRGGAGVMLARHNGKWTDPAFYDFGGVSVGAQAGGSGGPVAFILMSRDAVNAFKTGNQFSLNAGAGLSIVDYSANGQTSAGKGDIVMWSNTKGAYAGATISVSDINWDDDNNQGYYGKSVSPKQIINGKIKADKGASLKSALKG